jgi:hypothetical protein
MVGASVVLLHRSKTILAATVPPLGIFHTNASHLDPPAFVGPYHAILPP